MTVKLTHLPNGMRIVTDSLPHVETATLGMWVHVGSRHEPATINGIAHVLEHMAFKGTQRRSALKIAEEIEAVGGYLNAYTSRETTAYHARILKEDFSLATDILADILQHSIFDPTEFVREQGVIIQEIGQTNDTPDDVVFDLYQETCFPQQAIGRSILGTQEIIQSLTPEIVQQYMKQHYATSRMVFAAAGKVDHDQVVDIVTQSFTSLATKCNPLQEPVKFVGGTSLHHRDLEQVHLVLGYEGIPFNHPDYYALSVLSTLLGGGMSSRLFQEIREKRGLVYSVYSYANSYQDTGLFTIYAGTGPDQVKELLPVIDAELAKLETQLSELEIHRAKAQLKASLMMSGESTTARCEQAARQTLIYGKPLHAEEIMRKIDQVSFEQLQNLSQKLFKQPRALTALGPVQGLESSLTA
jgi:predicted Zn-dependent peptidase